MGEVVEWKVGGPIAGLVVHRRVARRRDTDFILWVIRVVQIWLRADTTFLGDHVGAFVGRQSERGEIVGALKSALHRGMGQVIVVRGEAGIGKTRLIRQILAEASVESGGPFRVGYGQAMSTASGSEAYAAMRECLRSLVAGAAGDQNFVRRVVEGLVSSAPDWLAAVPVLGDALAGGASLVSAVKGDSRALREVNDSPLQQLVSLIERVAGEGPLILAIDDLHWADVSTLEAIATIALANRRPVSLLLGYRLTDARAQVGADGGRLGPLENTVHRLQRYLDSEGRFSAITLGELGGEAMRSLVIEEMQDNQGPLGDLDQIVGRAAGNPLFAQTLANLPAGHPSSVESAPLGPTAISAVLSEQLSFLDSESKTLLEFAAVVGTAFEIEYLAALARRDLDDVYEQIDLLYKQGNYIEPHTTRGDHERYVFHHPLLCDLLRESVQQNGPLWRRLNTRLLKIYRSESEEDQRWDDDVVVRALECARASDSRSEQLRIGLIAASRQLDFGALQQAIALSRIAQEAAETPEDRCQVARVLMKALNDAADHKTCQEVFASIGDDLSQGGEYALSCALTHARSVRMVADWPRLELELDRILRQEFGPVSDESRARVLMLRAEADLCGPTQDTDGCLNAAKEVLELSTDLELRSRSLGHMALAQLAAYNPDEARDRFEDCIAVARQSEKPYVIYEALHWYSKFAMAMLDLELADGLLSELDEISTRHGVAGVRPYHARDLSRVRGLQKRPRESAELYQVYWESQSELHFERSIDTLLLQLCELAQIHGPEEAKVLVAELDSRGFDRRFQVVKDALVSSGQFLQPRAICLSLGISDTEFSTADSIFRFDVPDLAKLRQSAYRPGRA